MSRWKSRIREDGSPLKLRLLRLFLLAAFSAVALLPVLPAQADEEVFSPDMVVKMAKDLGKKSYVPPSEQVPDFLLDLNYDAWRDIRFRPEKALWKDEGLPFQLQFFHPGLYYDRTVTINIVENEQATRVPFHVDAFDYGRNTFAGNISSSMDYAGFRVHTRLNTKDYFDEFLVFLGASYFRAVGKGQCYGLSARGLAIDTAESTGEEFPYFREFWIQKPAPGSDTLVIYALLDSPSLAGAYTFTVHAGEATTMDVQATLFLRKPVKKLGLAPLTSMFLSGENSRPRKVNDFRPEVHDSDGLLMAMDSGEWLWRPLSNPETLQVNSFVDGDPVGFGLLQRDRSFQDYEDLEARYDKRPSLWVQPVGRWGKGRLELVLIPTDKEIHDNVAAYWVPDEPLPLGESLHYEYTLSWDSGGEKRPPSGYTVATRSFTDQSGDHRFVIDFEGDVLSLLADGAPVEGVVSCGQGAAIVEQHTVKNQITGGWRLSFAVRTDGPSAIESVLPDRAPPVELRAFLRVGDVTLTETWSYGFKP